MTKDGPFCGCFGSPTSKEPLPPRPKSAPQKGTKLQAASIEQGEAWKIGSQVTQTLQPQTSTPPVSPGRPADSVHGVMLSGNKSAQQIQHVTHCTALLNSAVSQVQELSMALQVIVDSSFHAHIHSVVDPFWLA